MVPCWMTASRMCMSRSLSSRPMRSCHCIEPSLSKRLYQRYITDLSTYGYSSYSQIVASCANPGGKDDQHSVSDGDRGCRCGDPFAHFRVGGVMAGTHCSRHHAWRSRKLHRRRHSPVRGAARMTLGKTLPYRPSARGGGHYLGSNFPSKKRRSQTAL